MAFILFNLIPFLVSLLSIIVLIVQRLYFYRKLQKGLYKWLPAEIPEYHNALSIALDNNLHGFTTTIIRKTYNNNHVDTDSDDENDHRVHSTFSQVARSPAHNSRMILFAENIFKINNMINKRNEVAYLCQLIGCIIAWSSNGILVYHTLQYQSVWDIEPLWMTVIVWVSNHCYQCIGIVSFIV
jgi:hypothetical protein